MLGRLLPKIGPRSVISQGGWKAWKTLKLTRLNSDRNVAINLKRV